MFLLLAWIDSLGGAVRNAALLVILALFSSQVFAYGLQVKVTVSEETLAVGTNISIVHEGVEIANAKAGVDGTAKFEVGPGSYFILLRRQPYPLHVSLIQVDKDTSITLTMRQVISYANAYGQISGPQNFYNTSVTAYSGSQIAKKITHDKNANPDSNGYYVLSFLPEGNYRLLFEAPGFEPKETEAFLPSSQFVEINAKLKETAPIAEPEVLLVSPPSQQQYSSITILLTKGGAPIDGAKVIVHSPSGQFELLTSPEGTASVNAAEAGQYKFAYGQIMSITDVKQAEPKTEAPPPPLENQTWQLPNVPPAQSSQNGGGSAGALAAGVFGIAIIGLAAAIVLAGAWFFFFRKGGREAEGIQEAARRAQHGGHNAHAHHKKHKEG